MGVPVLWGMTTPLFVWGSTVEPKNYIHCHSIENTCFYSEAPFKRGFRLSQRRDLVLSLFWGTLGPSHFNSTIHYITLHLSTLHYTLLLLMFSKDIVAFFIFRM